MNIHKRTVLQLENAMKEIEVRIQSMTIDGFESDYLMQELIYNDLTIIFKKLHNTCLKAATKAKQDNITRFKSIK
jgi:hypothetical protein